MERVNKVEIVRSSVQSDEIFEIYIDGHYWECKIGIDALYRCLDEIFKPKEKECLHLDDLLVPYGVGEITSAWDERFKSN